MSEEPPLRRTVRDFIRHHGISRAYYLEIRLKAKIRPRDWNTTLSASDERALLRYIGGEKRNQQVVREIREQPRVSTQFVAPPPPSIDYTAEISRMEGSLAKWRTTLIELARLHVDEDRNGRCKRCHAEAPCETKQTLARLDNNLVEQLAIADSGDLAEGYDPDQPAPDLDPERQLRLLYDARNRWRTALTELTMDHIIEDGKGHCGHCPVGTPCDVSKVVARINRGIARQIEKYACMDDAERDAALGKPKVMEYYEDDWDVF